VAVVGWGYSGGGGGVVGVVVVVMWQMATDLGFFPFMGHMSVITQTCDP
jgi:hypothetical protein